ncbi:hypothetical protein D623_10023097 [Myotis brandtii]|uniref:Uncharacterized protein n=1 Tax=Myotis brandtii TaxID=109478 RepID=S7PMR1_MYOBR|nr:hypothetical protein D623_10023097 [Myotis brandtii]
MLAKPVPKKPRKAKALSAHRPLASKANRRYFTRATDEAPKDTSQLLSSSGIFWLLRDMQKISKAATRQKAKTKGESEALGTIKLANWPLSNWELATF